MIPAIKVNGKTINGADGAATEKGKNATPIPIQPALSGKWFYRYSDDHPSICVLPKPFTPGSFGALNGCKQKAPTQHNRAEKFTFDHFQKERSARKEARETPFAQTKLWQNIVYHSRGFKQMRVRVPGKSTATKGSKHDSYPRSPSSAEHHGKRCQKD